MEIIRAAVTGRRNAAERFHEQDQTVTASPLSATLPWRNTLFGEEVEIEAYVASSRKWETVAVVRPLPCIDAEEIAEFILSAVNASKKS